MSTTKNGKVGTLDTMGETVWYETKDLQYFTEIHGNAAGTRTRYEYIIDCIADNLDDYIDTLDHAIQFLWKRPLDPDGVVLSLLSVEGKVALLRKLILDRSNELPVLHRMNYLSRFEDDFDRYIQVEQLRNKVLRRYLLEPSGTWLRELVDADDWIVAARFSLEKSMICEHQGYASLKPPRPSLSVAKTGRGNTLRARVHQAAADEQELTGAALAKTGLGTAIRDKIHQDTGRRGRLKSRIPRSIRDLMREEG